MTGAYEGKERISYIAYNGNQNQKSKNKVMLADSHSGYCIGVMIKFHTLNDATSNGSSKNDHNMFMVGKLKNTSIYRSF